jgi:hypothetical protein
MLFSEPKQQFLKLSHRRQNDLSVDPPRLRKGADLLHDGIDAKAEKVEQFGLLLSHLVNSKYGARNIRTHRCA